MIPPDNCFSDYFLYFISSILPIITSAFKCLNNDEHFYYYLSSTSCYYWISAGCLPRVCGARHDTFYIFCCRINSWVSYPFAYLIRLGIFLFCFILPQVSLLSKNILNAICMIIASQGFLMINVNLAMYAPSCGCLRTKYF